jgi:uncharacterized protein with von Willebrand factor type A (vWA) domain
VSDAVVHDRLAALAATLRGVGVRVGTGEVEAAGRALLAVGPADREDARLAMRAVLCSRSEDLLRFDAAFALVFGAAAPAAVAPPGAPEPLVSGASAALPRVAVPPAGAPRPVDAERAPLVRPAAWSDVELLRDRDFATYSDVERALARAVIRRLAERAPLRRSRRTRPARRASPAARRPDMQRTLRASLRHGGEPLDRHWRTPARRQRPLVLVCDVSGSMAPYARVLFQYLHAAVAAHRRVEAFAFGTRLTRITHELAARDPDRALARAAGAVEDWSGGTRIGDALGTLNREHGRRLGRGAVVVVLSDGWDRGEPQVLAAEMARLRRSAHRVIWLNPLKAHAGYEPLARGMAAALPHTDHFLAGSSLRSLEELAGILEGGLG